MFGALLVSHAAVLLADGRGQSAAGALVDWTLQESGASAELFHKAEARGCHPIVLVNEWVAALEEQESEPGRYLHVLADHHGNRSPRARPDARGSICGLTLERGEMQVARLYGDITGDRLRYAAYYGSDA